jgi:transposase
MYHIDMIYTVKTLYEKGKSQRAIARELGISRKTVKRIIEKIKQEGVKEPKFEKDKKLDKFNYVIKAKLEKGLTAKLIWQQLMSEYKADISYPTVSRFIKRLRQTEVYIPLHSLPGEEAQVDYGYLGRFMKDGKLIKVWCFSMVLSYSRYAYYEIVSDQTLKSFILSHIHAFEFFGGVPKIVKIDNLKAGVLKPDFYQPAIQDQYAEFLYYYNSAPVTARVRRPQDKGKVEAGIKYVKNNFLKTINHNDFYKLIHDLRWWNENVCNKRIHGTTKKVPYEMFIETEKSALTSLPDCRYEIYEISQRKVNQYGHITFEHNYYSVPYEYTGQNLIVKSNGNVLKIYKDQKQVALHPIDCGKGNFITCQQHKPPYKQYKNKEYYLQKASMVGKETFLFCQQIIKEKPYHYQRLIYGILSLTQKYSHDIVNKACLRALQYHAINYITVKNICEKGLYNTHSENLSVIDADGYKQNLSIYDKLSSSN